MKNILFFTIALLCSYSVFSQEKLWSNNPLQVSYFGHFGLHPGIKLGTEFSVKNWEKERKNDKGIKLKQYLISPQIGFYTHPGNHSGLIVQAEFSKRTEKVDKRFYYSYGAGFGYVMQINPSDTYIFNDNGEITEKNMTSRSYFMPSLHIETGLKLNSKMSVYNKITLASKVKYNTGFTLEPFYELGIRIRMMH
ncbi:MAG: hypothetical protein AB8B72_10435 [Crocinitomicaceae bacterium]